jgi:hypothetical protein
MQFGDVRLWCCTLRTEPLVVRTMLTRAPVLIRGLGGTWGCTSAGLLGIFLPRKGSESVWKVAGAKVLRTHHVKRHQRTRPRVHRGRTHRPRHNSTTIFALQGLPHGLCQRNCAATRIHWHRRAVLGPRSGCIQAGVPENSRISRGGNQRNARQPYFCLRPPLPPAFPSARPLLATLRLPNQPSARELSLEGHVISRSRANRLRDAVHEAQRLRVQGEGGYEGQGVEESAKRKRGGCPLATQLPDGV